MSNFGQGVLAVAGGVVGFFIGGPTGAAYGFQLGLLAGSALFPTKLPGVEGPRLTDQRTTTSEVGAGVPIIYGTYAVAGQVMDLGPVEEVKTTQDVGGKGGPSQEQTTYTYFQPIAIGLCEGPIDGILRIWENGELVYEARQDAHSDGDNVLPVALDLFLGAYVSGVAAKTATYQDTFTLYPGTEDQMPDPTFEAIHGVGETPAHRGLAYIVYHRRQLIDKQGLRHPNFKFEVVRNGQFECVETLELSNEVLYDWLSPGLPVNFNNSNVFDNFGTGTPSDPTVYEDALEAMRSYVTYKQPWEQMVYLGGWNWASGSGGGIADSLGGTGFTDNTSTKAYLFFGNVEPNAYVSYYDKDGNVVSYPDDTECFVFGNGRPDKILYSVSFGLSVSTLIPGTFDTPIPNPPLGVWEAATRCSVDGSYWWQYTNVRTMQVDRAPGPPLDPCAGKPNATVPGFCIINGQLVAKGTWTLRHLAEPDIEPHGSVYCLTAFHSGLGSGWGSNTIYPRNPTLFADDPKNTEEFWTTAYNAAVTAGQVPAGWTYQGGGGGAGNFGTYPEAITSFYSRPRVECTGDASDISLAEIVADICARVGVTRVDVSELINKKITGYCIAQPMPARAAIDPLKSVGFFDIVESPPYLAFRVRGRTSSITFTQNEMGAYADSEGSPPPVITTRKLQDVELPRSVRIHYIAPTRDYDTGEQLSAKRITTEAENDVDIQLAVCLEDVEAKRIADVLWADAWRSRWVHETSLDHSYIALEPADVLIVPVDGQLERLRIISIDDSIPTLRKLELCRDDDGSYVSVAVVDPVERQPNEIEVLSPTDVVLLDLPSLRDSDNDAGIYVAAQAIMENGVWHGGVLRYSVNDGQTFTDLATVTTEAIVGTVVQAAGIGITTTWDDANEIIVKIPRGALSNKTEQEVIEKANTAAIGIDGRWELVQFTTAEEISAENWKLTHLLRGRKGTEYLVGTGKVGDTFVLVSGPGVVRAPLDTSEIGVSRIYKSISIGASADTGIEKTFATNGICLLPYSVVYLQGTFDINGNMTISWLRRGRLGHELTAGAEIPLSEAFERYEVELLTAADVIKQTYTVNNAQSLAYSYAQQLIDFGRSAPIVVRVYQISDVKGRGTVAEATFTSSPALEPVLPPIDYPNIYARITFGGTPDGNESVVIKGTYAPKGSASSTLYLAIDGSGKTLPSEYADALYTYLTGLPLLATANISQPNANSVQIRAIAGDTLTLFATEAYPYVRFEYDTEYNPLDPFHDSPWIGGTYRVPQAVQNGIKQQFSIDLYDHSDPSPDSSNLYRKGGSANIQFTVYALDYDVNKTFAVPYLGQSIVLNWTAPNNISDLRTVALEDLVANNGLPKPVYALLAQYADYIGWSIVAGRQVVYVTMKYGYWVAVDLIGGGWTPRGLHPSGFSPGTQQVVEGAMRYPSGTKWMSGISFYHYNDAEFYNANLGAWQAGMTIQIVLDGTTYSYTIDGTEADALNTTENYSGSPFVTTQNAIMTNLKAQIELAGTFVVKYEVATNGQYNDWRVERTAANTPVVFSGQVTGYDLTIVNELFDEDNSP